MLPKYRAWIEKEKCIKIVKNLIFDEAGNLKKIITGIPSTRENTYKIEDVYLMAFTGLHDSVSNKEVYEEDIFQGYISGRKQGVYVIKYDANKGFYRTYEYSGKPSDLMDPWLSWPGYSFEVIGNTFENPNLLKYQGQWDNENK